MSEWETGLTDEENARWQAWEHEDECTSRRVTAESWARIKRGEYTQNDINNVEAALRGLV